MPVHHTKVELPELNCLLIRVTTTYNWDSEMARILRKVAYLGHASLTEDEVLGGALTHLLHYRMVDQQPKLTNLGHQVINQLRDVAP